MFSKGQKVSVVGLYSAGNPDSYFKEVQFRVEQLVVYSCGKKQMILQNEAGVVFKKQHYLPQEKQYGNKVVIDRVSDEVGLAIADKMAVEYCEREAARFADILSRSFEASRAYWASMKKGKAHYEAKPIAASFVQKYEEA